ncbi:MAG: MotA/TolQ/ExbB proton channel family protein [Chloroflexi bacterium]|nr:MotA/TolQ/ExbB proton channel family protein [Chloroflexota bacterium]MDA1216794.1 MotA/TolQ/ExbB proton channel family protein [Chloroflexota bacterium]
MNLAMVVGIGMSFGLLMGAGYVEGGMSPHIVFFLFSHITPFMITLGGGIGAAIASVPAATGFGMHKLFIQAFTSPSHDTLKTVEEIVAMADTARKDGVLALEAVVKDIHDPFLQKGMSMVVDGLDASSIESVLRLDTANMQARHHAGIDFFNKFGAYAPTMGIIGTVMGLIEVLKNLNQPEKLGGLIGVAFLATLWGVMLANCFFLPMGSGLIHKDHHEAEGRMMALTGILGIQAGENPRVLKEKLLSYVAQGARPKEEA